MLRKTLTTLAATTLVLLTAHSAAAHVEVNADNPQALAQNVELTWSAESESATAGIKEVRVVLPKGIAPADITLASAPKSWALTATSDGFAVKGAPLPVGEDAEVSVTVKQLPDAKELVFKTLQTYGDGKIDRWIELEEPGEKEEEGDHSHSGNPAPVLKLKAAALVQNTPTPSAPASAPANTPASTPAPSTSPVAAEKDDNGGMSGATWAIIGIAVAGVLAITYAAVRRRTQSAE